MQPLRHIKDWCFLCHCLCIYGGVPAEVTRPQPLTHGFPGWSQYYGWVRVSWSWKKNPCLFPENLIDRLETGCMWTLQMGAQNRQHRLVGLGEDPGSMDMDGSSGLVPLHPSTTVSLPLSGHKEQFLNSVVLVHMFPRGLLWIFLPSL